MAESIHHKLFFPHSPEVVWEYLTRAELMELWLMKNDFRPVVGHEFRFWSKPIPALEWDGNVYCKVLEVTPFKKLSYSWKGGPGEGKITMDSVVVWTLLPKDNGTELILDHSGFKNMENIPLYSAMHDGWRNNMHKIPVLINAAKHGTTNA